MSYHSTILAEPSLVAYWQLNETQGGVAVDSKGGRPGFYGGGCILNRAGPAVAIPRSVFFNGASTAFIEVPTDPVFHPNTGYPYFTPATYSVEAWVKLNVPLPFGEAPFSAGGPGAPWVAGVAGLGINPDIGLVYEFEYGSDLQFNAGQQPLDGNWYHLIETFDGAFLRGYRNGFLVLTHGPFSAPTPGSPPIPFVIGGFGPDSFRGFTPDQTTPSPMLTGYISNVAFYNTALTQAQIVNHVLAAFVPDPTPHAVNASTQIVFTPTAANVPIVQHGQTLATQVVAEVARGQIDGLALVTQVVIETVRPFVAGSANAFDVAATASVVFTAGAHAIRGFAPSATASIVFTARANAFHGLSKNASVEVVFRAVAALTNVETGSQARATIIFRARAKNRFLPIVYGDDYLGRFQLGQAVPLWDLVRDQHGEPALPTAEPPEARVYNLDTRRFVETVRLTRSRRSRSDSVYARALPLGPLYSLGRHAVTFRAPSGGFTGYNTAIFEVVAGGDAAGPVLATHTLAAPGGDQVLAQLGDGALAKGSRPRVG